MLTDYYLTLPFRFVRGIYDFLYFWYIKSSKDFWRIEVEFMKGVEREIGLIVNLKLITQPIFGDYSSIGRIIGPIFRFGRVMLGFFIVFLSIVAFMIAYLVWLLLPPVAFIMAAKNFIYVFLVK